MTTVTILVLGAIILVLFGVVLVMARGAVRWFGRIKSQKRSIESLESKVIKRDALIDDLQEANARLRAQVQQIPLAPKPKKDEDAVIRAKSPAAVRQLTEQRWGKKPADEEQDAIN